MANAKISALAEILLGAVNANDTIFELSDLAEALPADQSKKVTAGRLRDWLSTAFAALGISGNFAVNVNKFTVAAASGNTAVAGTLNVAGATTGNGGLQTFGANDSAGAGFRAVRVPNV